MADLKTIIEITQGELKKQVPTHQVVWAVLDSLSPREADVLARRFGLRDGKTETLQAIGAEFGITRERVRQLEKQGLAKFKTRLTSRPLSEIVALAVGLIRENGGVMSCHELNTGFLPESQQTEVGYAALAFLMEQADEVVHYKETKHLKCFYALSAAHQRAVENIEPALKQALSAAKQPQKVSELYVAAKEDAVKHGVSYLVTEPFIHAALAIGRAFVPAPQDRYGLASWPEINPRTIRDKTLFVLRKSGRPMHFTDITESIRGAKFDGKRVTTQAVHNELINGNEFVLIGRGIYAMNEWGYIPGTVAEVIRKILTKAGAAMDREEIIQQVLKQRHVSRNTILINLQEKAHFRRVDKHSYALRS